MDPWQMERGESSAGEAGLVAPEPTGVADGGSGVRALGGGRLPPGAILGRYRISGPIGEGAQGVVYEGAHRALGYRVAIKVVHEDCDAARRARFGLEARIGATLRHRHVVQVLESGALPDGSPYMVMEHVDGCSLAELVEDHRLAPAAAAELGEQLLAAITALSERGVLHRDVKPENVMLERSVDGQVSAKLCDLGISKPTRADELSRTLTQDGVVLGTPYFMAPEQARGRALDVRTDLYAVAGVLYRSLTGRPPHDGATVAEVLGSVTSEPVRPLRDLAPSCPREIARIVDRALRADPDERWAHPLEMAWALREAARRLGLPSGASAWADAIETADGRLGTVAISHSEQAPAGTGSAGPRRRSDALASREGWTVATVLALWVAASFVIVGDCSRVEAPPKETAAWASRLEPAGGGPAGSAPAKPDGADAHGPPQPDATGPAWMDARRTAREGALPEASDAPREDTARSARPPRDQMAEEHAVRSARRGADDAARAGFGPSMPTDTGPPARSGSDRPSRPDARRSAPPAGAHRTARADATRAGRGGADRAARFVPARPSGPNATRARADASPRAGDHPTHPARPTPTRGEGRGAREPGAHGDAPSLAVLERRARGLFVRGEPAAAMGTYRRVIQRSPRRATAWRGLGLVAAAVGRPREARRALTRYLELTPSAPDRARIEHELQRLP